MKNVFDDDEGGFFSEKLGSSSLVSLFDKESSTKSTDLQYKAPVQPQPIQQPQTTQQPPQSSKLAFSSTVQGYRLYFFFIFSYFFFHFKYTNANKLQ